MTLAYSLRTIFEILMIIALFWGIFNEGKLIAFEKRIISAIRRSRLKVIKTAPKYRVIKGR